MPKVTNASLSAVNTSAAAMAATRVPTNTIHNGSWSHQISLAPSSLLEPMIEWQRYFNARGFKDWAEAINHFDSVAKLTGEDAPALMIKDMTAWGVEVSK